MKQFLSFVRKEFYHIFRDVRTMLIIIGIPVAQILIIGFAVSTDVKNVKLAVYDPSNDVSTRQIIQRLDASESFQLVYMLHSAEEAEALFKADKINFAVIFSDRFNESLYSPSPNPSPQGRGDAAVQFLVDATDPNQGTVASSYAASIIGDYQQELMQASSPLRGGAIIPQTQMLYNPGMRSSYNFVPGLMGFILVLICAMMTSIAIVREKETGTMEVLLASPIKPIYIVLAKMTPYFVISWFILIVILLMSVFILGVPISGNLIALNIFSLIFIVVAAHGNTKITISGIATKIFGINEFRKICLNSFSIRYLNIRFF